jgi:putative endonuclease
MAALAVSRHPSGPALFLGGAVAQLGERLVRNEEVRGSTPLGSTSLRSLRELRLGRPVSAKSVASEGCRAEVAQQRRRADRMKYVYILRSVAFPDRYYTGITEDLRRRMQKHNAGEVSHTSKYKPWKLKTYMAFSDEKRAFAFERYLKSPSGRAFAKKRL